jgi:hypothetical protein
MFIKPLETFLIYNGWTIEENTLLSMFGGESAIDMATAAINTKKKTIKKVDKKTTSLF